PRAQRLTWLNQFIAGGQNRNTDLANHIQLGATQRRSQTLLDRPQARTRRQNQFTDSRFLALWTNVLPRFNGFDKCDSLVRQDFSVFLHLDTIGPGWNRCPCENPRT